jgi:hypothetical protein
MKKAMLRSMTGRRNYKGSAHSAPRRINSNENVRTDGSRTKQPTTLQQMKENKALLSSADQSALANAFTNNLIRKLPLI